MTRPRHREDERTIVAELVETLREARAAVDRERIILLSTPATESDRLRQFQQSLRNFALLADRLLVVMADRGLDGPLMDEAEQLYDLFHGMEAEIGH